jgi:phage host-nuclease inhibitor protein Gam
MAKKEVKKPVENVTREQAETAFKDYSVSKSKYDELSATMEQKLAEVRERYSSDLVEAKAKFESSLELLETFANQHPELFEENKTVDMLHGTITKRKGNFAFKQLKSFTKDKIVLALKVAKLNRFIRTKTVEEIDKEGLIAERDNPKVNKHFQKAGIEIVQEDYFYFEPKTETVLS